MELVFEPDLKDGSEAACLVRELILILKQLDTCTCRIEGNSFIYKLFREGLHLPKLLNTYSNNSIMLQFCAKIKKIGKN